MSHVVLETEAFTKLFCTLNNKEKEWIKKMIEQLRENSDVGKPLGFTWFREKKFEGKRLYYLIYKNSNSILLVAFGDKKEQQKIISYIIRNKERYRKIVETN